ncbi:MAG: sugar ABC transporter permease [Defluviitaleaceae bacterium]|nr:sugar ABC transporter permease [Defluviitaleaceae bacterium]MCL2238886.1 sugar ABC transporter permease [Defluviitaleaceae bacterium]
MFKREKRYKEPLGKLEIRQLPWIYFFLLPSVIIFLMFYLWPIVTVGYTSLTRWNGFTAPEWIGIENFTRLFGQTAFRIALRNLGWWSLIAATMHVGFGVLVALIFYKGPPGWKVARTFFMVPNVTSVAAWAMIYRFVFRDDFGLLNNFIRFFNPDFSVNWFFVSPYAFWAITFTWVFYAVVVTLVVLSDLMAIPQELQEAARIDGAGGFGVLWRINLPLCRFSIGTAVIMSVTARITMFEAIDLTTRGGPGSDTMALPLILVRNLSNFNYGMANATAVVMFVLGIIVMLAVRKIFRMDEPVY